MGREVGWLMGMRQLEVIAVTSPILSNYINLMLEEGDIGGGALR